MSYSKESLRSLGAEPLLGRLAGGLAHEFNNLFTAISGSAQMVQLELGPDHPAAGDLVVIRQATDRGVRLIAQILLAAGKRTLRREKILALGWQRFIASAAEHLPETIRLDLHLPADVWPLYADQELLDVALEQLVANAQAAMPQGGVLTVALDNLHCDQRLGRRAGPYVRLSVEDTGVGIDEAYRGRIFQPFFTTRHEPNHAGLGLAMVRGIVRKHGGWVEVSSLPGEGTRFSLYWPAQPVWDPLHQGGNLSDSTGQERHVLVVEDEEDVREFTMMGLSRDGYRVSGAATVREAESLFGQTERCDLVLSDMGLPDGSGVELIQRLKVRQPGLKVVLSSGYADHYDRWPAIRELGYPFLEKPYALQDLLATIRQMNA